MKRIRCSLLVTTLLFGSVLAKAPTSKDAKMTFVCQHELPSVVREAHAVAGGEKPG